MLTLGFHGGHKRIDEDNRVGFALHDSAAVLIEDGEILAAIEEERLNRIKHSNCFPVQSIKYCLGQKNLTLSDIDLIATNSDEMVFDIYAKQAFIEHPEQHNPADGRKLLTSLFEREFGIDITTKLRFYGHHLAHAWSAYGPSGYANALILVLDGDGDNRSGMALLGEGPKITRLKEFNVAQSLGNLYTRIIGLLGYHRFDEYKVMGLAPYGDPSVYSGLFEQCYQLLPNGDYSLASPLEWLTRFDGAGFLTAKRKKGDRFTQAHKDIAAALQTMLEKIVLHILSHYRKITGRSNLCLAGGVAHNCSMNGKILYSELFEQVFVQPAAHDAGGALGAAYAALKEDRAFMSIKKVEHLYFGTHIGDDQLIEETLRSWSDFLSYEKVDSVAEKTARLLADGNVVGWVQGRSEFGPRALGNRSILADPRPAKNKLLINEMVKKRESYRPFAPSILEERVGDFYDVPKNQQEYPFMIFVVRTNENMRNTLGAVTHLDGTARLHTISKKTSPLYHDLISEFEKQTGVPVLLNTSFNNNAEPIVDTVEDAIVCYLTTGLNYLVIGDYVALKRGADLPASAYGSLVVGLPPWKRLVQRSTEVESGQIEVVFELESGVSHFFSKPVIRISVDMFKILQGADGGKTVSSLMVEAGIHDAEKIERITREIIELWSERAVILRPVQRNVTPERFVN
jgi:carbamoyltransferase